MRPPIVSEQDVRIAIDDLEASGQRVTGLAVRRVLAARLGARGGVTRIYRLVRERRAEAAAPRTPTPIPSASDESREAAIARADLAEHRERAHQERWARETDALRTRLVAAETIAARVEYAERRVRELLQALASAQARIQVLERSARGNAP